MKGNRLAYLAVAVTTITAFAVDTRFSEVMSVSVFYLPLVLISLWLDNWRFTLLLLSVCSVLLLVTPLISTPAARMPSALATRFMTLVAMWLTTIITQFMLRQATITRDTAELNQTIESLQQSEERLRLAIESAGIGTYLIDYATGQFHYSAELAEVLGLPNDGELTLEDAFQLVHPDDVAEVRAETQAALNSGAVARISQEIRIVRPAGGIRHVFYLGQVDFRDSSTGPVPYRQVGVCIDITNRKQTEITLQRLNETLELQVAERTAELQEKESRHRAVLDAAVSAIVTIDEHGIVQSANPATERLFGYSRDELIGRNVKVLMPPPFGDEHDQYLANYLRTGVRRIIGIGRELPARRKDGAIFHIELVVSESTVGQRQFIGIMNDVSQRKALERAVVESAMQEEKRIGRELHDGIGQELTGLCLLSGALAHRLRTAKSSECSMAEKLAKGLERAHEQLRMLGRGLVFSEMNATELEMALRDLVHRVAEQSSIACELTCPEPILIEDSYIANHLFRIAQEAISNALRHGEPKNIRIALCQDNVGISMSVLDDGGGIANDIGDSVHTGEGMGIATMRYRAQAIGGTLQVKPVTGGGTSVTCVVPGIVDRAKEIVQTRQAANTDSHR